MTFFKMQRSLLTKTLDTLIVILMITLSATAQKDIVTTTKFIVEGRVKKNDVI